MTIRTHKMIVTFKKPFLLGSIGKTLPAGNYEVVTDEELLEGLSFYAYRRLQTYLYRQFAPNQKGMAQSYVVDPNELVDAVERDETAAIRDAGFHRDYEATEPMSENGDEMSNHEAMTRATDDGKPCRPH
jgi:hypothetical protein